MPDSKKDNLPVQKGIPSEKRTRDRIRACAQAQADKCPVTPPVGLAHLRKLAGSVLCEAGLSDDYLNYATVLVSNALWQDRLAGIPYNRRLLLLPQCLRDADNCPAVVDEFGMICRHCGRCVIHELVAKAEQLGYATLIAEGTAAVTLLIKTNKIDAVVGASCLSVLEQIFPYMEAAACPGIAIPLLRDGCRNTAIDLDWLSEAIELAGDASPVRMDIDSLKSEVAQWFDGQGLADILGTAITKTEQIAHDWLSTAGKRWRPFLAVCTYRSLSSDSTETLDQASRQIAVAVECFHKASLIHDDIEDEDSTRYGRRTMHESYGVPVALNAGDFLIGEGYRLIAEANAPPDVRASMLVAAAQAHRQLCMGQGAELIWARTPKRISVEETLRIYELKTSPAFEVSLQLGAILAGCNRELSEPMREYSRALGVAYQLRDDLEDLAAGTLRPDRPSALLALAGETSELTTAFAQLGDGASSRQFCDALRTMDVARVAQDMLAEYKHRAIGALQLVRNGDLKALLRRAIARIFGEIWSQEEAIELRSGHASRSEESN